MKLKNFIFIVLLSASPIFAQSGPSLLQCTFEIHFKAAKLLNIDYMGWGQITCNDGQELNLLAQVALAPGQKNNESIKDFTMSSHFSTSLPVDTFFQMYTFYSDGSTNTLFSSLTEQGLNTNIAVEVESDDHQPWQIWQQLFYSQIDIETDHESPHLDY